MFVCLCVCVCVYRGVNGRSSNILQNVRLDVIVTFVKTFTFDEFQRINDLAMNEKTRISSMLLILLSRKKVSKTIIF